MRTMDRTPIEADLERWIDAGIIDRTQADAIRNLDREPRAAPVEPRIPLIAEVLGYVGAALAVVALWISGAHVWEDLAAGVRVALLGGLTLLLLIAGTVLREAAEPALARLRDVLWAAAGITAGVTSWFGAYDLIAWDWEASLALAGAGAIAVGGITLPVTRSPLQHIVLVSGLALSIGGLVALVVPDRNDAISTTIGGLFAAGGLGWLLLNRSDRIPAADTGQVLGAGAMYLGAAFLAAASPALMGWVGLAGAAAVTTIGIVDGKKALGWVGALGFLIWIPTLVFHYFGEELGAMLGLLIVGVLFISGAVLWTRRTRR